MRISKISRTDFDALNSDQILVVCIAGGNDILCQSLSEVRKDYLDLRHEHEGVENPSNSDILAWQAGDYEYHNGNNTEIVIWGSEGFERLPAIDFRE